MATFRSPFGARPRSASLNTDPRWDWWWANRPLLYAVPRGTTMADLANADVSIASSGSSPVADVVGPWGAAAGSAATAYWFWASRKTFSTTDPITFGAIFRASALTARQGIVSNHGNTAGTGLGSAMALEASQSYLGLYLPGVAMVAGTTGRISANTPYFAAISFRPETSGSNNIITVIRNLLTGQTTVDISTFNSLPIASGGALQSAACFNSGASAQAPLNGRVGLTAIFSGALTRDQLVQWALDPYGPYWPDDDDSEDWFGISGGSTIPLSLLGSIGPTGALARQVQSPKSGTISPTGAPAKAIQSPRGGLLLSAGSISKAIQSPRAGSFGPSGALSKAARKLFTGTIAPSGSVSILRVVVLLLAGTIGLTGSIAKSVRKVLAGALSWIGSLTVSSTGSPSPGGLTADVNIFAQFDADAEVLTEFAADVDIYPE